MYPELGMEYEISVEDFQKLREHLTAAKKPLCLLDVRQPWEAELATMPGSCLIPMGELPSRASEELDSDADIVVYCHHGHRSLDVAMWLREQGFSRARSLAGGIEAWSRKIDPSVPHY